MVDKRAAGLPKEVLDAIERGALLNATRHGGRAEVGAVVGMILAEFAEMRSDSKDVAAEAGSVVNRVNSLTVDDQRSVLQRKYPETLAAAPKREETRQLPPLPNAVKGKTAFRIPPEPSGFMTIGHAMAFTINSIYSDMYDGQLWLRFEDTNPRLAVKRYYDNFRQGLAWLGIVPDHEKNLSDDMELIYGYGRKLLESGQAYACSCAEEKVKKERFEGKACVHRDQTVEVNLRHWDEMLAKKHREGTYVIRLKGDMSSMDFSLRDPNVFRIIDHDHPLTGSKYVVWPTYNLANAIEDEVCGITHILRSTEFPVALQEVIREKLSFRRVEVIQFTRFNFKGTPVHKRLLRPLVEQGLVSGWDDPRMPTVDGVRRRGIIPEAIRQFTLQVGYTKTEHEYEWSLLFAVNRKLLDPVSRRIYFVPNPVRLAVEGAPARRASIRFHPDVDMGSRTIDTSGDFYIPRDDLKVMPEGTTFRLMDLYNVELLSKGNEAKAKYAGDTLIQDTRKVQWVTEDHAEVKVVIPGELFDAEGQFDKASLSEARGFGERAIGSVRIGEIVQLPRFGFCRLDSPGTFILAHR
ncbi:MAG TPA: glutamate--tRNA ligase [Nitrososphaerales archaeon]|nr:glutamate--tRNA ligase [Nitrososphaerales archaeon]